MQCAKCQKYFSKYTCTASRYLECDCPKCQGMCECYKLEEEQDMTSPEAFIEEQMRHHAASAEYFASQRINSTAPDQWGVDDNERAYTFARAAAYFANALEGKHTRVPIYPTIPWIDN